MEDILDADCHGDIINTLPEEILERILSYLSPYGECKQALMVCKRWHRVIQGMYKRLFHKLVPHPVKKAWESHAFLHTFFIGNSPEIITFLVARVKETSEFPKILVIFGTKKWEFHFFNVF